MGHPKKHELLLYAESLVDKRTAISARLAGHVASCPSCMTEVHRMRTSFACVAAVSGLEPSSQLTSQILLAAHEQRQALQQGRAPKPLLVRASKALAYAACIAVVSALCFGAALGGATPWASASAHRDSAALQLASGQTGDSTLLSPDAILKAAADIQSLLVAISHPGHKPQSLIEQEHLRAVHALTDDLETAKAALQRNPGSARANDVVDTYVKRQAQTLRTLYIERSL
jgi:hypothetical protein